MEVAAALGLIPESSGHDSRMAIQSTRERRRMRRGLGVSITVLAAAAVGGAVCAWAADHPAGHGPASIAPAAARALLVEGNARFRKMSLRGHHTHARLLDVSKVQRPFAVVLGCADSRVPPELVFDARLGDLFVIRIAGNIVDDAVLGSIEYAVEHLGTRLVVVLGHERCGAVSAAIATAGKHGAAPGHLPALLEPMAPAVKSAGGHGTDAVDRVVRANVAEMVRRLRHAGPVLDKAVHAGRIQCIGARYDLDTGLVEFLP
jgi:carbonic anhydrase